MTRVTKTPIVSVILNSFNQGEYLRESIESVLNQTFSDFELIIVDNGSTDNSKSIINEYADQDARIRPFLFDKNEFISIRFNFAVTQTRGKYVSFLYSDDFYLPNKLADQVRVFETSNDSLLGVVYSPPYTFNQITKDRWLVPVIEVDASGFLLDKLLAPGTLSYPDMISQLTRRELLIAYPFYEDIISEGEAWYYRAAMTHRFALWNTPVAVGRDHLLNRGKSTIINLDISDVVMKRLRAAEHFPSTSVTAWRRGMAHRLQVAAWSVARTGGHGGWAARTVLRSLRYRPRFLFHYRTLGTLALAAVPHALRQYINTIGNRLRRLKHNSVFVKDYQ